MAKHEFCYNCGIALNEAVKVTREHIPQRSLYEGFSELHKTNVITVPACYNCNNYYSKQIDEEFRNNIGVISKQKQNDAVYKKTIRSLKRNWRKNSHRIKVIHNRLLSMTFNADILECSHKKNFKGIFYEQYGYSCPPTYDIYVNMNERDWSKSTLQQIDYLKYNFQWKVSGHEDVFKYIIQPFREEYQDNTYDKSDLFPINDEEVFLALMVYNREIAVLVIAVPKNY